MGYGDRLKDIVEKEAKEEKQKEPAASKEKQQKEEEINLTQHEHETALNGTYRSFVMDGTPKKDIDSYFEQAQSHIKLLIEEQLKEMESAKIILTL